MHYYNKKMQNEKIIEKIFIVFCIDLLCTPIIKQNDRGIKKDELVLQCIVFTEAQKGCKWSIKRVYLKFHLL